MKKIYSIAAIGIVAATMLVSGCKKENGTVMLSARIDNDSNSKVYIEDRFTYWHNGDLVRVNNETCTTSAAIGVEALIEASENNEAPYRAIFPMSIVGETDISGNGAVSVTLPSVQMYRVDSEGDQFVDMPMGAYATSSSLVFRNLCSLLKVELTSDVNFFLDHITVTSSNAYLSGAGEATIASDGQQKISMLTTDVSREVSLDFNGGSVFSVGVGNTYVFYIVVPEIVQSSDITISMYDNYGRSFSVTKYDKTLGVNQVARIPMHVTEMGGGEPLADGELLGVFSVGDGMMVHFSRGNLQYNIGSQIWQFAQHQYDFVGGNDGEDYFGTMGSNRNNYITNSAYTGLIDLFSWGATDVRQTSFGSTFVEWGDYITDATCGSNIWKTLSLSQWVYLMNRRSLVDNTPLWGLAMINVDGGQYITGLILLPDDWVTPSGLHFTPRWDEDDPWRTNVYDMTSWTQMEEAGAVFLPCGGFLWSPTPGSIAYSYTYMNGEISYWGYENQNSLYAFYIYPGGTSPDNDDFFSLYSESLEEWQAYSVRLVRFLNNNAAKGSKR